MTSNPVDYLLLSINRVRANELRIASQRAASKRVGSCEKLRAASQQAARLFHCKPVNWNSITMRAEGQQDYKLRACKLIICGSTCQTKKTKIYILVYFIRLIFWLANIIYLRSVIELRTLFWWEIKQSLRFL